MNLRSALVGREAERARLSQAIESARQGTGGRTSARRPSSGSSATDHAYALGALAHAMGEAALLEGESEAAAEQLSRAP